MQPMKSTAEKTRLALRETHYACFLAISESIRVGPFMVMMAPFFVPPFSLPLLLGAKTLNMT